MPRLRHYYFIFVLLWIDLLWLIISHQALVAAARRPLIKARRILLRHSTGLELRESESLYLGLDVANERFALLIFNLLRVSLEIVQALRDCFSRHSWHHVGRLEHLTVVELLIVTELHSHLLGVISIVRLVVLNLVQPYQVWIG